MLLITSYLPYNSLMPVLRFPTRLVTSVVVSELVWTFRADITSKNVFDDLEYCATLDVPNYSPRQELKARHFQT